MQDWARSACATKKVRQHLKRTSHKISTRITSKYCDVRLGPKLIRYSALIHFYIDLLTKGQPIWMYSAVLNVQLKFTIAVEVSAFLGRQGL